MSSLKSVHYGAREPNEELNPSVGGWSESESPNVTKGRSRSRTSSSGNIFGRARTSSNSNIFSRARTSSSSNVLRTVSTFLHRRSGKLALDRLRGLGTLYKLPTRQFSWTTIEAINRGEVRPQYQHEDPTSHRDEREWGELFLDLTFVAVSLQEGRMLTSAIENGQFAQGLGLFIVTILVLFDRWDTHVNYRARFRTQDLFHRVLDIVSMLTTTVMALHLDTAHVMFGRDNGYLTGFAASSLLGWLLDFPLYVELAMKSRDGGSRGYAWMWIQRTLVVVVAFTASTFLAIWGYHVATVVIWACTSVFLRLDLWLRWVWLRDVEVFDLCGLTIPVGRWLQTTKAKQVPVNEVFTIRRYREWTMLMLGESVLQIVLADVKFESIFYVSVVLAYLLTASLQLLRYAVEPGHLTRDCHCRSNVGRIMVWKSLETVYSMALIAMGAGLKLALQAGSQLGKSSHTSMRQLLCLSVAIALVCLLGGRFVQKRYQHEKLVRTKRAEVAVWCIQCGLAGIVALTSYLHVNVAITLAVAVLGVNSVFALQIYDARRLNQAQTRETPAQRCALAAAAEEEYKRQMHDNDSAQKGTIAEDDDNDSVHTINSNQDPFVSFARGSSRRGSNTRERGGSECSFGAGVDEDHTQDNQQRHLDWTSGTSTGTSMSMSRNGAVTFGAVATPQSELGDVGCIRNLMEVALDMPSMCQRRDGSVIDDPASHESNIVERKESDTVIPMGEAGKEHLDNS